MSMGFFVEENAPVVWRGPMLGKMLNNFFHEVDWGEVDYIVLDLPPGTGDVALDVHTMLPSCKEIIVSTPHPTAAFVAARAGSMAIKTDHEVVGSLKIWLIMKVQNRRENMCSVKAGRQACRGIAGAAAWQNSFKTA